MADAARVIARLKAQLGEVSGENAILVVELEETREALAAAEAGLAAYKVDEREVLPVGHVLLGEVDGAPPGAA